MVITARGRGREEDVEEEQTPKKPKTTQQQHQQQEVDRISQLPDDIRHPILSLLTLKEACITSSLSKGWRNLFPSLPCLLFDDSSFGRWNYTMGITGWLETVSNILESRRAPVRICTISSSFFDKYSEDFSNIIIFLCNDGILELTIDNMFYGYCRHYYTVPACLYFCRTLTRIKLRKCILKVPAKFSLLRRLNALKIVKCTVEDGDLQRLISGCRAVVRLTVKYCSMLRNIVVDAPTLEVLDVTTCRPLTVSIAKAPRLESVTVRFKYNYWQEDPEDGSDVDGGAGNAINESEVSRLLRLVESLGDIQNLSLDFPYSYMERLTAEGVAFPLILHSLLLKLKKLTLKTQLSSIFMLSIVSCLLHSCPNLEDLVIVDSYDANTHTYSKASDPDYWDQQMPSDCMRYTLGLVTMYVGFGYCWKYLIKLVKFLLNNAPVLKKLVINFYDKEVELSKMVDDLHKEMLLLSPASPDAVVEFKTAKHWILYRPAQLTFGAF